MSSATQLVVDRDAHLVRGDRIALSKGSPFGDMPALRVWAVEEAEDGGATWSVESFQDRGPIVEHDHLGMDAP